MAIEDTEEKAAPDADTSDQIHETVEKSEDEVTLLQDNVQGDAEIPEVNKKVADNKERRKEEKIEQISKESDTEMAERDKDLNEDEVSMKDDEKPKDVVKEQVEVSRKGKEPLMPIDRPIREHRTTVFYGKALAPKFSAEKARDAQLKDIRNEVSNKVKEAVAPIRERQTIAFYKDPLYGEASAPKFSVEKGSGAHPKDIPNDEQKHGTINVATLFNGGNGILMASDTRWVRQRKSGHRTYDYQPPKIYNVGNIAFGGAGEHKELMGLVEQLERVAKKKSVLQIAEPFRRFWKGLYQDRKKAIDTSFILCGMVDGAGHIYQYEFKGQFNKRECTYGAIGTGSEFAIPILEELPKDSTLDTALATTTRAIIEAIRLDPETCGGSIDLLIMQKGEQALLRRPYKNTGEVKSLVEERAAHIIGLFGIPLSIATMPEGHSKVASALAIDRLNFRVLSGSYDGTVHIYNHEEMNLHSQFLQQIEPFEGHQIHALSWSPSCDCFVSITSAAKAQVYNRDGLTLGEFIQGDINICDLNATKGHTFGLTCGEWHPKTKETILTSSEDGSLRIWDVNYFNSHKQVIRPELASPGRVPVTTCAWDHDGTSIAGGIGDGSIQIWDLKRGRESMPELLIAKAHIDVITGVKFSSDGRILLSRSFDDSLKVWDLRQIAKPLKVFERLPNRYAQTNIAFSHDETLFLTGTSIKENSTIDQLDGTLWFYDKEKLELVYKVALSSFGSVVQCAWHPKLNQVFATSGNEFQGTTHVLYDRSLSG